MGQAQAPSTAQGAAGTPTTMASPPAAGMPAQRSGATSSGAAGSGTGGNPAANSGTPEAGSGGKGSAGEAPAAAGNTAAAGTPAAGTPATPTTAAESFETGSGDTLIDGWELSTTNCMGTGTVTMDSTQAHSGTRSVRVNGGGGYCNHVFFRPKTPLTGQGPVYARFFVRFEKPLTQSHVTFVALRDDAEMKDLRMGGQSEILMWNRESDDATLPELSPTGIAASVKPETGKWLCIELLVDGNKLETWLDGMPVQGLTVEGESTPDIDAQWQRKADWHPSLSDIRFGWESYGSDENTLWYDDVLLGTTRSSCE
jgi:hypothetical protein